MPESLHHLDQIRDLRCTSVRQLDLSWARQVEGLPASVSIKAIAGFANCPLDSLQLDCCVGIDLTDAIVAISERSKCETTYCELPIRNNLL